MSARSVILIAGPPLLVGLCYWLTLAGENHTAADSRNATAAGERVDQRPRGNRPARSAATPDLPARPDMHTHCMELKTRLLSQLDTIAAAAIIRPPFLLIGDASPTELARCHDELIAPIQTALQAEFFAHPPTAPITVILLSDDDAYRRTAIALDDRSHSEYYGYYVREDRRVVVNLATGGGTLAHELTHALADADFPGMPPWFNEGLASLFEDCEFTPDGRGLRGLPNWRRHRLQQAMASGTLPALDTLLATSSFRGEHALLRYAHARYFCLYLQHRGLLRRCYRRLRATAPDDATGRRTLIELLGEKSLKTTDDDFRVWLRRLNVEG